MTFNKESSAHEVYMTLIARHADLEKKGFSKNSFVHDVYMALIAMQTDLEKEGVTPVAVLQKMEVMVTAMNKKRVLSAIERMQPLDVIPGLRISQDGRIHAHQQATKH